jgi:hypothetical protein
MSDLDYFEATCRGCGRDIQTRAPPAVGGRVRWVRCAECGQVVRVRSADPPGCSWVKSGGGR